MDSSSSLTIKNTNRSKLIHNHINASISTLYTLAAVGRHPKERNAVKMEMAEAQVDNLVAALWEAQMEDDMEEENADMNAYYGYDNYDYSHHDYHNDVGDDDRGYDYDYGY